MKRALAVALVGAAWGGCTGEDPTELVVVVYSNIDIPAEMDGLSIRAVRGDDTQEVTATLGAPSDLPKWLVLAHEGGQLGPIEVTVEGTFGGSVVITQRARTSFIEGERLVLTMRLLRECGGIDCGADMTCSVGGCRSIDVDPATLVTWPGSVDRVDGAVPPGGCPEGYEDCDGDPANGCETSLRDPMSCGTCDTVCPDPPSAMPTCSAGSCAFVCEDGRGDCNGTASDGCETDLASPLSCGGCDVVCGETAPRCGMNPDTGARICTAACPPAVPVDCAGSCVATMTDPDHCGTCFFACPERPNATRVCTDGACGFACVAGYADCDGLMDNGCETALNTLTTCGACGTACSLAHATATCATGTCEIATCDEGFADCNGDASDGCEAALTSVANCGGCGMLCDLPFAMESCATSTCMLVGCDTDYADCDGNPMNGCEVFTSSPTDCGACGVACSLANATESCATGTCVLTMCDSGYGDCDGAADTGCETRLDTMSDCGSCGSPCSLPRAMERCTAAGACEIASCDPGYADCNGMDSDGCEVDLSTTTNCSACGMRCTGGTPVCDPTSGCVSGCASGETLCGSTCADTQTDPNHCGACGNACSTNNATPACSAGSCVLACDMGWANCNGDLTDGCETPLNTLTDCGSCGTSCSLANATESCATGMCTLTMCDSGYGNCDGNANNGCEARLDTLTNCGTCGSACNLANATESCSTGSCVLGTCSAGYGNCDGAASNGCETPLTTLSDCGMCGRSCNLTNATESCASGTCTLTTCDAGWGNCNTSTSDGCETSLTTTSNCGSCGMGCNLSRATESCATGTCDVGMCDTNWGNCDGMASNGCETDVRDNETHCGMCGNDCTFPRTECSSGSCSCPGSCACEQTGCATGSSCTCNGGCGCELTCADNCSATCEQSGTTCVIDATVPNNTQIRCRSGATCTIDARGTAHMGDMGTMPARCEGSGTSCDVDCSSTSTGTCRVDCTMGAACELACHPSRPSTCSMTCTDADGGSVTPTHCGGGLYVCNRAC